MTPATLSDLSAVAQALAADINAAVMEAHRANDEAARKAQSARMMAEVAPLMGIENETVRRNLDK